MNPCVAPKMNPCAPPSAGRKMSTQLSLRDLDFNSNKDTMLELQLPKKREIRCAPEIKCTSKRCCKRLGHGLFRYFVHVGKTAVRRGVTVLDVVTDMRTFLILWNDPNAAYWSCFLLASMFSPYLVFWSSRYNFQPAVRVLDEFARQKPKTLCENLTRLYYTLISVPILGLLLTSIVIAYWWCAEIIMGLFCKPCYRKARNKTERLSTTFNNEKPRSILPLMSYDSMRFFTISEMFYESFPQLGLQIVIYMSGLQRCIHFKTFVSPVCLPY